jgi:glutamine synthetase
MNRGIGVAREAYILACHSDFAGQVRGKGFPLRELDARWEQGIGWTPTNIMINCFGNIPATPFGAVGDLVLRPDPAGQVLIDFEDDGHVERFVLSDILNLDGSPWEVCPRNYLREGLGILEQEFGLRLKVAFEHEFTCVDLEPRVGAAYGIEAIRSIGDLPEIILALLRANRLEPETFLPEFSPAQFELTVAPAPALEAADRAVKLRQIVRAACERKGWRASFSPIMRKGGVGNGVHIHFSLEDLEGRPVSHDPDRPAGVSQQAAPFVAGVLAHGRALCAVTAPTVISYDRLRPNAWSASVTNLGQQDREALVRICPIFAKAGGDIAKGFNFEFRAADAAATPHMALGALVRAGSDGIRKGMALPQVTSAAEAAALPDDERRDRRLLPLPTSLGEALDDLESDQRALMPPGIRIPYIMHKRGELGDAAALQGDALFTKYAEAF